MANYKTTLRYTPGNPLLIPVQVSPKPLKTWVENDKGKRAPNGPQATDENGVPLWVGSATLMKESFGETDPELVEIVFASKETPKTLPAEIFGQAR